MDSQALERLLDNLPRELKDKLNSVGNNERRELLSMFANVDNSGAVAKYDTFTIDEATFIIILIILYLFYILENYQKA